LSTQIKKLKIKNQNLDAQNNKTTVPVGLNALQIEEP